MQESDSSFQLKIIIVRLTSAFLSILGSLFIIYTYRKFPEIRNFVQSLILYLCISDLIFSITPFTLFLNVDQEKYHVLCVFQAFVFHLTALLTIFWTSIIAYSLYKIVVNKDYHIERLEEKFLIVVISSGMLLALIPLALDYYGPSSHRTDLQPYWCGIVMTKSFKNFVILDFTVRFGPITISMIFNTIMYFKIKKTMKRVDEIHRKMTNSFSKITQQNNILKENTANNNEDSSVSQNIILNKEHDEENSLNKENDEPLFESINPNQESNNNSSLAFISKLIYYPMIPLLSWSVELVFKTSDVVQMYGGKGIQETDVLKILSCAFVHLHGLFNAILYGITPNVYLAWKKHFKNKKLIK